MDEQSARGQGTTAGDARTPDGKGAEDWRAAIQHAMLATPFLAGLGLRFERFEPDDVVLRLAFRPELTNDGQRYHGGVVAAVMDTAGAAAAWSNHDPARGTRAATVAMTVQYVGSAAGQDLVCAARTIRRVRELIFTEIHATDPGGNPVAHGVQTYRIA
ncbi:PaaI family thioesterase [Aciditerrimonas ferrireducens]|nr:PaaI family thioesterase [Aciditerrimonas ferrireducens]MCK4178262.1 PaaI family thioesterase [Aciditerrimonas ferrireducens]